MLDFCLSRKRKRDSARVNDRRQEDPPVKNADHPEYGRPTTGNQADEGLGKMATGRTMETMKKENRADGKGELAREIALLEDELRALGGEPGTAADCPPEIQKAFLESVLAFEKAQACPEEWEIDLAEEVRKRMSLPENPRAVAGDELRAILHALLELLVSFHCVPIFTDHLSDFALYRKIREEILPVPLLLGPNVEGGHWFCDCCDTEDWLRYHADDHARALWAEEFDERPPDREPVVARRDQWISELAEKYRERPLPLLGESGPC